MIFLFSCAGPITVGPGGISEENLSNLLESGLDSLESGDTDGAKDAFEDVLAEDPDNPTANAGMSVILLYELFRDYSSEITQFTGIFRNVPVRFGSFREIARSFSFMKYFMNMKQLPPLPPEPPVPPPPFLPEENPIETWNQLYESISATLSELWPRLKDLELCLENAIKGNASITLHPNNFDWDGDGALEPEEPPELSDGTNTYSVVDLFYGSASPEGTLVVVQSGGDAWFDFETISGQNPEEIVFDENDYLILDKGAFSALLLVVKAALSISDLLLTWDLTLPSDLPNPADYEDMGGWIQALLDQLAGDDDVVSNDNGDGGEWNELDPFLVFRENGSSYLEDLVDSVVKGIQSILWLNEDIEEDNPGDEHDFTSMYYFEEPLLDENTENILQEVVNTKQVELSEGEPFTYKQTETETLTATIVAIDFGVLAENSGSFEDLKVFFPTLNLQNGYFEFPDPTFGGLLVLEE